MPQNEVQKPAFYYGYIIAALAFIILLISAGTINSYGIFFKPMATEFGWTRSVTSGAYSVFFFFMGFFGIIGGRVNDRFGPRALLTVCGLLFSLGCFLMSQIDAVWQLYLVYGVLMGVGTGSMFVAPISTVAKWFVRRRGMMTGIAMAGTGVGVIVIPLLATQLIALYSWHNAYIVIAGIALIIVVIGAQFMKQDPRQLGQIQMGETELEQDKVKVLRANDSSLKEAIRTSQLWMLFIIYFAFLWCVSTVMVHLVPHVTDLGNSAVNAASVVSVVGMATTLGRIGIGIIGDKIGNKGALIIACISMLIGVIWLTVIKDLWMFYAFAVVFGFSWGGFMTMLSPLVADLYGLRSHGVIWGFVYFVATIGGAIGPLLAGSIYDITDSYTTPFIILDIAAATALILALLIKRTVRSP